MENNQDHFNVLRIIQKKPNSSQRELAKTLGFSLGKLNYCIQSLHQKGLIKIYNFKQKKNKFQYVRYFLSPKGITIDFWLIVERSLYSLFFKDGNVN